MGEVEISPSEEWKVANISFTAQKGTYPLFLEYLGTDYIDIIEIGFN